MATKISSALLVFFVPSLAFAQVIVSEIMYDLEGGDTDREWIEVHNNSSESVTLTEWKLFENKTNHGITAVVGETLPPGAYAVIADDAVQFKSDWPSYTGLLFDSAFSLNNTGETLGLRCCQSGQGGKDLVDKDMFSYASDSGGAGDGDSLHRSGSSVTAGKPSPGTGAVVQSAPPSQPTPPPPPPSPPATPQPAPTPTPVPMPPLPAAAMQMPPLPVVATSEQGPKPADVTPQSSLVAHEQTPTPPAPPATKKTSKKKVAPTPSPQEAEDEEALVDAKESSTRAQTQIAAVSEAVPHEDNKWLWYSGALAISLLGAYGAFSLGKSQGTRKEKEWEIEEID